MGFQAAVSMTDPILITSILFVGLVFKFAGFAVRDELWLRILVTTGLMCDVIFYALRSEPVPQSVAASVLLVSVNLVLLLLILTERTTWRMSAEDRTLYASFPTLTPGQFRRLRKIMRRETVGPGTPLALEGKPVDDLMLVYSERIEIEKSGASFPIAGPAFVGEIALLTGNPSSASVRLPEGGTVVRIPLEVLTAAHGARARAVERDGRAFRAGTRPQGGRQRADGPRRDGARRHADGDGRDAGMSPTLPVAFITISLR